MKRIIALTAALIMVLSLTACFGVSNTGSTADEASAADISTYEKTYEGLVKYIADRNSGSTLQELYYDIVGADRGARLIFNNNPYVEIYDFSSVVDSSAEAKSADPEKAKSILEDIKDDGKFRPVEDGVEMTAVITKSGKYVIAWDPTRNFAYDGKDGKAASDDVIANW